VQHFTDEHEGMAVVDANGQPLGKVAGVEDGQARLEPETGIQSRMEAAAAPDADALAIRPEQVVDVRQETVRIDLNDET
jgi:hypothetical protein